MTKIIGILGPAGSGKSTAATYLVEKYGACRYSFAHPLKKIVRQAFDLTKDQVWGSQRIKETVDPRYGVSPRWLLQRIGTEGIRNTLGSDFWWELCMQQILADEPRIAVIDDFRFENEVNGFLSMNINCDPKYPMVHIWRIESDRARDTQADASHQSETEWMKCAYTQQIQAKAAADEDQSLLNFYDAIDEVAGDSGLSAAVNVLR
jgi:adenylate kinase family enzyme